MSAQAWFSLPFFSWFRLCEKVANKKRLPYMPSTLRLVTPVASLRGQPARQGSATAVRRRLRLSASIYVMAAALHVYRVAYAVDTQAAYAPCAPTAPAPAPLRASRAAASRTLRAGLPRPSMRSTTRAVFAATPLTSITPARLKSHATRPVTTHSPRVMPFAETARAPCARYARRSPAADGGLRGNGGEAPPDRCGRGFIEGGG